MKRTDPVGGGRPDDPAILQPRRRVYGSDGEAESQIRVVAPDYQPWFQPL